jgi:hypothetical protein
VLFSSITDDSEVRLIDCSDTNPGVFLVTVVLCLFTDPSIIGSRCLESLKLKDLRFYNAVLGVTMSGKWLILADLKRLIFGILCNYSSGLMRPSISGYALFSDDSNKIYAFDSEFRGE